ncbi:hypothetical protein Pcinc_003900 [Petrolisthes cinctipes]|uniref:Uncharacterized protein n=1 Tax=Petrolisthes cinctipes TaxID=88211 RepID=A0AAE1GIF5_PETCI|nr:hypothetical protein Pcinc_003900 [Petrolisthes cinctipes]
MENQENEAPSASVNASNNTAHISAKPSNTQNRDPRLNIPQQTQESSNYNSLSDLNKENSLPDLNKDNSLLDHNKDNETKTSNTTGRDQRTNNHKTREKHNNHIKIQPAPALGRRGTRSWVRTEKQLPVEESQHDSSEDDIEGSSEEDIQIEYTQENPSTDSRNMKQHGRRQ